MTGNTIVLLLILAAQLSAFAGVLSAAYENQKVLKRLRGEKE